MDYCDLTDVYTLSAFMGELHDAPVYPATTPPATIPTETQGKASISRVSEEIDGRLRTQNYPLPVIDPETLATLRDIAAKGAAARILRSRYPAAKGAGSDEGAGATLREDYQDGLKRIDADALRADAGETLCRVVSGFHPHYHDYRYHDDHEPRF